MDRVTGMGSFPIVTLGIIMFALVAGATLLGMWMKGKVSAARAGRQGDADTEQQEMLGPVISSILGLLALLLGFTFALSVDRFESRRGFVLQEANDIGTAYLQAQLLTEVDRARVSDVLVRYTNNRIVLADVLAKNPDSQARDQALNTNDALVQELWTATVAAFPNIQPNSFASAFVGSINKVIDDDTSRKVSRLARVPNEVFLGLFIYVMISAMVLGFMTSTRTTLAFTFTFNALVVMALMIIVDIDRPALGGIRESQEPMLMLQKSLASQPPGFFDRLRPPAAVAPASTSQ